MAIMSQMKRFGLNYVLGECEEFRQIQFPNPCGF
jgi:hypothetical protein